MAKKEEPMQGVREEVVAAVDRKSRPLQSVIDLVNSTRIAMQSTNETGGDDVLEVSEKLTAAKKQAGISGGMQEVGERLSRINTGKAKALEAVDFIDLGLNGYLESLAQMGLEKNDVDKLCQLVVRGVIARLRVDEVVVNKPDESRFTISRIVGSEPKDVYDARTIIGELNAHFLTEGDVSEGTIPRDNRKRMLLSPYAAYSLEQYRRLRAKHRETSPKFKFLSQMWQSELKEVMPSRENVRIVMEADNDRVEERICVVAKEVVAKELGLVTTCDTRLSKLLELEEERDEDKKPHMNINLQEINRRVEELTRLLIRGQEGLGDILTRRPAIRVWAEWLKNKGLQNDQQETKRVMAAITGKTNNIASGFDPDTGTAQV